MPPSLRTTLLAFAGLLTVTAACAATPPDFSGAWRLDDRNSDTTDTLTTALLNEARSEQQANAGQPPAASSSTPTPGGHGGGGHHGGGMGGGGMGGGGHGGGMGGGGMGGGGHGGHGGDPGTSKAAAPDKDPIATATYPMPPMLKVDSVVLVQQDPKTFQIRLNDGSQLTGKLDSQARQSLSGNAMVRGHMEAGQMIISIQYQDDTRLDQTWTLSPDGQQMTVTSTWKVPTLEQPVIFKRIYVGLH